MKKVIITSLLFLLFITVSLSAAAEQRLALVIGNGSYDAAPLANPVNDASDMAAALKKLGFTVILKNNANLEVMEEAIEDFGNRLKKGGIGLFFYAGHGIQVYGSNYLIPIGAKIKKYNPSSIEIFRSTFNPYVLENWTYSHHNSGYGWREKASNTWIAGTCRVDLYVEGVKIASETFNMY
ncbi:MAG: caspase family protein [Smithellaceae bacterium]|nr:caspase family protein [Smithellaceae bacterium]